MKRLTCRILVTALALSVVVPTARSEESAAVPPLRAGRMFSDLMILQRDMPVPVWGEAAPGERVVVSIRNQEKTTKADADGKWMVKLDPLKTGEPATLTIRGDKGKDAITFTDVLVGEVWIGTGQSSGALE